MCKSLLQRNGMVNDIASEPSQGQSFTMTTGALAYLSLGKQIDFVTFRPPNNAEAKRILQIHASRYFETARLSRFTAAGACFNFGYALECSTLGEHAEYIAMWSWQGLDARERWYAEFRSIVENNFERLGHIVDGIRLVATGGISCELLDMQIDMFGWRMPEEDWPPSVRAAIAARAAESDAKEHVRVEYQPRHLR